MRLLVNRVIDATMSINCAALTADIPPGILGWLLLNVIGALMILILASFIYAEMVRRRNTKRKAEVEMQSITTELYPV